MSVVVSEEKFVVDKASICDVFNAITCSGDSCVIWLVVSAVIWSVDRARI